MEQAKWLISNKFYIDEDCGSEYIRLRSLFYLEVLKWQLQNRSIKRFHYSLDDNVCQFKVFVGWKKAFIVRNECKNVYWAVTKFEKRKGENKNG